MKPPVHSIRIENQLIVVRRLKTPRFRAVYDPITDTFESIDFEDAKPDNTAPLEKKALAALNRKLLE